LLEKPAVKTLFEGDCLDMFKQTPDNSIHLIVTSPPYNLQMEYEQKLTKEEYLVFIEKVLKECYRVLVNSGRI
jgi:site-specific DNA-methyltransferase (adenine-specific)